MTSPLHLPLKLPCISIAPLMQLLCISRAPLSPIPSVGVEPPLRGMHSNVCCFIITPTLRLDYEI